VCGERCAPHTQNNARRRRAFSSTQKMAPNGHTDRLPTTFFFSSFWSDDVSWCGGDTEVPLSLSYGTKNSYLVHKYVDLGLGIINN
jgi:hypothetical protein